MTAARVILLAFLLGFVCPAWAEVAVPPLTGRVVDQTGTLSAGDIASLTDRLKDLETRKGSQIAVLIVPTTGEETIEQFSIRVAEAWKIGRKKVDDGALLVVAKNDRHLRIEVGYGLEGVLSDAVTHRIIDEDITPKFKAGDFAGGVSAGVDRMIRLVNGEQLPAPEPEHWQAPNLVDLANPVTIFIVIIVAGVLRGILGRLLGSIATGGVVGFFTWMVAGSLATAFVVGLFAAVAALIFGGLNFGGPTAGSGPYRRGGGYSGGGGWSSGSSSSDSGGFSGGGGSFGGGGASGSW
ncbi:MULTISPECIES: YgcG family protein [Bradyrhizobium]|uniref:YgcG family protein n=1 Tax=Bradyrhizobium elkanii TaxID=29448 RepID=A0A4U6S414_BRAEL|nr:MULTISPECIES: YgcG family protein [Bradyrhizobium]MTV16099.1 YgcG family protein [Bradyrhizobium sp. BR2003]TKV81831.1 YgcG family protein [Bradyrhizobium elkanii]